MTYLTCHEIILDQEGVHYSARNLSEYLLCFEGKIFAPEQ